jgi:phage repressor protein C with HTH and peptisase S24 domain
MQEPKDRLQHARESAGYASPTEAASRLAHKGVNKNTLISNENGNRAISRKMAQLYGEVFGVDPGWLLYGDGGRGMADVIAPPSLIPGEELVGARDFPVYAAAMGGHGHEIVTFDPIDWVKRPVILERVKGAYGILVVNTSMSPMYRPNDIALINPHLAPTPDTEVVLYHTPPHGEAEAMIKTLVGSTAKEWKLRQYNPAQDFTEDRVDWPICHRVVGKYDRR